VQLMLPPPEQDRRPVTHRHAGQRPSHARSKYIRTTVQVFQAASRLSQLPRRNHQLKQWSQQIRSYPSSGRHPRRRR
jgi:hypothetical protein